MDWRESLEIVVARTGHERYRALCADDHPQHAEYRRLVVRLVGYPWLPAVVTAPGHLPEAGADPDRAAVLARRAAKPRGPLGTTPKPGGG
jgi:hypothetical protein